MKKLLLFTAVVLLSSVGAKAATVNFDLTQYTKDEGVTVISESAGSITLKGTGTITFTAESDFSATKYSSVHFTHTGDNGSTVFKLGNFSQTGWWSGNTRNLTIVESGGNTGSGNNWTVLSNSNTNFSITLNNKTDTFTVSNFNAVEVIAPAVPIPAGYVSLFSLPRLPNGTTTLPPYSLPVGGEKIFFGHSWGQELNIDVTNYEEIAIYIAFDEEDRGKQITIRYSVNGNSANGLGSPLQVTLPNDQNYTVVTVPVAGLRNTNRKPGAWLGGIAIYNNASREASPVCSQPVTIEYMAVKEIVATSFSIEAPDLTGDLARGATTALKAVFDPVYSSYQAVTWAIESGSEYVSIDNNGVVTGVESGTAVIKATSVKYPTMSDTYEIIVGGDAIPVTEITLPETTNLRIGLQTILAYTALPEDATIKTVTWTSSDTNVAEVNPTTGKITAKALGTTTITATATDGSEIYGTSELTVTDYVAIPAGWASIYTAVVNDYESQLTAPGLIDPVGEALVFGPSSWGNATINFSDYDKIAIHFSYSPLDAGKQIAYRYSYDGTGNTTQAVVITLPEVGNTYRAELDITGFNQYFGGIVVYNGKGHWAFNYTGTPAAERLVIDYVALDLGINVGTPTTTMDNPDAIVNVYSITGALLRQNVKQSDATIGLDKGLYIVGNKKIFVTK